MDKPDLLLFHIHQLLFNVGMAALILALIEFKLQNLAMAAKSFLPVRQKQTRGMRPHPPLVMPGQKGDRE